jgi:hypothetical protein
MQARESATLEELDTPRDVLAFARHQRAVANAAEANILIAAVIWAEQHPVESIDLAATWTAAGFGGGTETGIPLAGPGAPLVAEFAIPELATTLGISTDSGRNLIAAALELKYRLPRHWTRTVDGQLPVWRARRIAEATLGLSREAATFVDAQVAAYAHKIGPAATDRLVAEAIARFMPAQAAEDAARAAESRHLSIDHTQVSFGGTTRIEGELDLGDALELDAALTRGAESLKAAGSTEPLDVRRAMATGDLARRQLALAQHIATTAYEIPDRLTEQTDLRDHTCVFPWCTRPARRCDHDHLIPHDPDHPEAGPTCSCNIAALCRRHHRLKTHTAWTYTTLEPGTFLWTSPHGYHYLRDHQGTLDVSTDPPAP